MEKTSVNGQIMWEQDGIRRKEPHIKPVMIGWHKVTVDGKVMWESPEGEREESWLKLWVGMDGFMNDKEVGELWRKRIAELEKLWTDRKGAEAFDMDMVISLIRKLVKERAMMYAASDHKYNVSWTSQLPKALSDFGIDFGLLHGCL